MNMKKLKIQIQKIKRIKKKNQIKFKIFKMK